MTAASIRPNGNSFVVTAADGAEHTFEDIKKKVLAGLHESLQCDIRIVKNQTNGNFQLSFGDELFVGVDRNLPREENDKRRSAAIGKRFAFLGALTNELANLGLEFGRHVSPRDTRQVRDQQGNTRWAATTQMWINLPGQGTSTTQAAATDETLMTNALAADEAKASAILDQEKNFSEDGKLKTVARARLRAIIAKGKASATPDKPAPKTETKAKADDTAEDMPTD